MFHNKSPPGKRSPVKTWKAFNVKQIEEQQQRQINSKWEPDSKQGAKI